MTLVVGWVPGRVSRSALCRPVKVRFVTTIDEVLAPALLPPVLP
jgi:hypothetical protein